MASLLEGTVEGKVQSVVDLLEKSRCSRFVERYVRDELKTHKTDAV